MGWVHCRPQNFKFMLAIMLPASKWLDLMLPQLSQFISPSTIYQGHGGTGDSALAAARRVFCPLWCPKKHSYSSPFPVASFFAFFRCQEILIREMGGPRLLTLRANCHHIFSFGPRIFPLAGWSYCRRIGDKTPGWLPADRIAELAQLIAGLGFSMTWQNSWWLFGGGFTSESESMFLDNCNCRTTWLKFHE